MHPLLEKIQSLRDRFKDPAFAEDVKQITEYENQARELISREELVSHPILQVLIQKLSTDIIKMDEALVSYDSEKLSDKQRDRLLDKKALYKEFLTFFDITSLREEIASVDNLIEKEIAHVDNLQ